MKGYPLFRIEINIEEIEKKNTEYVCHVPAQKIIKI